MKISDVIHTKSSASIVTVTPGSTVRELLAVLAEHNIGAAVVSSDGTAVEGIVSERDVVRHLHREEGVLDGPVASIMTSRVRTCEPHDEVDALMAQMTEHRIRHVPVVQDDRLVGVVSIGDVVKSRMDQLEFERDQLDSYVHQG
jgi:CBS domain-containing protein